MTIFQDGDCMWESVLYAKLGNELRMQRKFVKSKCPAKGIWQYKLSLSYLKEHLK
jgi:hypothetical protein